ncbi:MAG TPA: helicase associated domain-containing protein, partial [Verrucomicrobiae bacterium]
MPPRKHRTKKSAPRQGRTVNVRKPKPPARQEPLEPPAPVEAGSWEFMRRMLAIYRRTHGHCEVAYDSRPGSLGQWLDHQHAEAQAGRLDPGQRRRLEELGVVFSSAGGTPGAPGTTRGSANQNREELWEQRFRELLAFKDRFGHTRVPKRWDENKPLSNWVSNQRQVRCQGRLAVERITRLDAVGFQWEDAGRSGAASPEDECESRWDEMFDQLRQFKERHGHCDVPRGGPEHWLLARWALRQRGYHRRGELAAARKEKLEALGFAWTVEGPGERERWGRHLAELLAFKERFGHTRVPAKWKEDKSLGHWVSNQRQFRRKGQLTSERIARLDEVGFEWEVLGRLGRSREESWENLWESGFDQLREFKEHHGHCDVPGGRSGHQPLARWVLRQRGTQKRGELRTDRKERLDALGFAWASENLSRREKWERRVAELLAFKERFGHTRVPAKWKENKPLGHWVHVQREFRKKGMISAERIAQLDSIGFEWSDPGRLSLTCETHWEARWDQKFEQLREFKERHGHCEVPGGGSELRLLAKWVQRQRGDRIRGALRPDRKDRLDALGFTWGSVNPSLRNLWEDRFAELLAFKERFGHTRVPAKWEGNLGLGHWVSNQRQFRRKGRLSAGRIARLDAIGFVWDFSRGLGTSKAEVNQKLWEQNLERFVQFKNRFGHDRVPTGDPEHLPLADWVRRQRLRQR